MPRIATLLAAIGALAAAGWAAPGDTACPELQKVQPAARMQYLQGERSKLNRACILYAIERLGIDRYTPAIATLVGYLDYKTPEPAAYGPPDRQFRQVSASSGRYPAVGSLFQIGKAAIPQLVEVVAAESTSDLVRGNAADAVVAIYRTHPADGISVIVDAAHLNRDPMAALRLMDEARRQAGKCSPQERNDCENATLK